MNDRGSAAVRVTEIVSLVRAECTRKWPEWLGAAASVGNIPAMRLFLKRGADLGQHGAVTGTPLCNAVSAGQIDAVRWLGEQGASLDPRCAGLCGRYESGRPATG